MTEEKPIIIWDRAKKKEERELVYGGDLVDWVYGTQAGQALANAVLSKHFVSKLYGAYQASHLSRHKIAPFIRDFMIPMQEFEDSGYRSFNDFFIRTFKPGARPFVQDLSKMPAFAEARYLAYEKTTPDQLFPVKGKFLTPLALLGSEEKAEPFIGGPLLIARLCPTDYHRFHFPDDGTTLDQYRVRGGLHSVNPAALRFNPAIFATNERQVSLLETRNFGLLAYIEVGALCVGKIVQTYPSGEPFKRGDEKGYFLFGGSTVILLGQAGAWTPDSDLLEQTGQQRETLVRLGESVAHTS